MFNNFRMLAIYCLIFLIILNIVSSFTVIKYTKIIATSNSQLFMAATNLIRKTKLKEINELKNNITSDNNHLIHKFLATGEKALLVGSPVNFKKSVLNRFNTVSVMAEYNRKSKTGFIMGLPPPEIMGGLLRDAGAKAVVVSMEKKTGGATFEEFYRLCKEQYSARKFSPGPISVVWNDYIVDDIQIIYAAALGAAAVTLDINIVENLSETIKTCYKYDLEPIVLIKNLEEANLAIESGATVLCMRMLDEEGFISLKKQLPNDPKYVYIAKLRTETDFSIYSEIDTAWVLRDEGFHCVWPSPEAIYATTISDIYSNIIAMKSKAARKFLSPRQFLMDRNKEGAQEYLGDILY